MAFTNHSLKYPFLKNKDNQCLPIIATIYLEVRLQNHVIICVTVLLNPGFYLLSEFGNVEKTHFAITGMAVYFVEKKVGTNQIDI